MDNFWFLALMGPVALVVIGFIGLWASRFI